MSTQDDYTLGMSLADEGTKTGRASSQPISMIEVMHPTPKVQKVKRPPRNPDHPKAIEARQVAAHEKETRDAEQARERELRLKENDACLAKVALFRDKGIQFIRSGSLTMAYKVLSSSRASVATAMKSPKDPNRPLLAMSIAGQRLYNCQCIEVPLVKGLPPTVSLRSFANDLASVMEANG